MGIRFFIVCLAWAHLSVHAQLPKLKFDPKEHGFDLHSIGVGGNIKEGREQAFNALVFAVSDQITTSATDGLTTRQRTFSRYQLPNLFEESDFSYVGLERIGNKKYVAAGMEWKALVDRARFILATFPERLDEQSITVIQRLKGRLMLAQALLRYAEQQRLDYDPKWLDQLAMHQAAVDKRLNRGLLIFEGDLNDSIIKINDRLVRSKQLYLIPGLHVFEISRQGSHTTAGQLHMSAGEVRRLPIQLAKAHTRVWPIRLELTERLEAFQLPIIAKLRVLGMGVDNAAPQKLRASLNHHTVLKEIYNQQTYELTVGFYDNHQRLLEETFSFNIFGEPGNDEVWNHSVEGFVLNAFFTLVSQLKFDHRLMVENTTKRLDAAVIIENP